MDLLQPLGSSSWCRPPRKIGLTPLSPQVTAASRGLLR